MKKYTYKRTREIKDLLKRIERVQVLVAELPVGPYREESLRRASLLKSSLFSAKIEGNPLKLKEISLESLNKSKSKAKDQLEVANVLRGLRWIRSKRSPRRLSLKLLRELHGIVMKNLAGDAGQLRTQPSGIFTHAGVAVRLNPSPQQIKSWLKDWLVWVKSLVKTEPIPVVAALAHLGLEKIHPFRDGNGRVGRLVSQFILDRGNSASTRGSQSTRDRYDFKGLVSFEEYVANHRTAYYDLLAEDKKVATEWVGFFLEAIAESGEKTVTKLKRRSNKKKRLAKAEEKLLPRRKELLEIMRDHKLVSFDFLQRRFAKINQYTLRYDLRQLMKAGLVKKLGGTRGARYEAA